MTYEEAVKQLKGEDLLIYLKNENNKYSEWISLIEYALMYDTKKIHTFLEALVKNDWELAAVYPMCDEKPTKDMIGIGDIMDGDLFVVATDPKTRDWLETNGYISRL